VFQALRVHCPPAGTLDGQLLVSEKFQLTPIFRMSSVALPVLVKVTGWLKSPTATKEGSEATFGEVNVSFSPKRIGTLEGAVTIKDNVPSNSQKIPLTGIGTVVTLLPSSLDFVNQQVGITSPPQVATLTNYGTAPVDIHGIRITGKNSPSFAQTNNCGTSVRAGGSCTISVTFTPKTKGQKTATLDVGDSGGASPQTVALSGTGT
jgi:hypothetical protein